MNNLKKFNGIIISGPSIIVNVRANVGKIESINLNINKNIGLKWEIEATLSHKDQILIDHFLNWLTFYCEKKPFQWKNFIEDPKDRSFYKQVHIYLQTIPFGTVMSYKEVAIKLENPNAARAVGNACGINPFPLLIPCHRIVSSTGGIGGFSQLIEVKKRLLNFEYHEQV